MIPRALLYSEMSAAAQRLWAMLDDVAREAPGCIATVRVLAAALGVSARTTRYLIRELVDGGWLDVAGREGGRTHDVDGGQGQGSIYLPLRRRRPGVSDSAALPRARLQDSAALSRVVHSSPRARKEEEGSLSLFEVDGLRSDAPRRRRPPWCGRCSELTRQVERDDGSASRCPDCHPLTRPPF